MALCFEDNIVRSSDENVHGQFVAAIPHNWRTSENPQADRVRGCWSDSRGMEAPEKPSSVHKE